MPYILACHLQIDADLDPSPAYHFDAYPDPDFFAANPDPGSQNDPDPQLWSLSDSYLFFLF
jgi:hypothetical protein